LGIGGARLPVSQIGDKSRIFAVICVVVIVVQRGRRQRRRRGRRRWQRGRRRWGAGPATVALTALSAVLLIGAAVSPLTAALSIIAGLIGATHVVVVRAVGIRSRRGSDGVRRRLDRDSGRRGRRGRVRRRTIRPATVALAALSAECLGGAAVSPLTAAHSIIAGLIGAAHAAMVWTVGIHSWRGSNGVQRRIGRDRCRRGRGRVRRRAPARRGRRRVRRRAPAAGRDTHLGAVPELLGHAAAVGREWLAALSRVAGLEAGLEVVLIVSYVQARVSGHVVPLNEH